ncbi:MAG: LTA synthase family protein [Lysobacteraceae bacterium]|nr:MAG: LTA synthase family protein [Xanthomonadaceae bacterium]
MRTTPSPSLAALWLSRPPLLRESAGVVACVLMLMLLVARLDPGIELSGGGLRDGLRLLMLNMVPALALFSLLLALTRRLVLSSWLVLLSIGALYGANTAKLGMLETPLLPADLRFLAEPGPAIELFSKYLHVDALRWMLIAVGAALTVALVRERPLKALAGWRAVVLGAATCVLGASLMAGASPWRRMYQSAEATFQPWALTESSVHTGLIGSLLLYHWQIGGGDVPSADRAAALALLSAHAPELRAGLANATSAGELPDIVVVQSESLFDPARLQGVLSGRWLPQFHRLARKSSHGELTVPTFVGGTIRTEFEVLTGAPLASLGGVQYPWLELSLDHYPGIASVLGERGYRRLAVHPNAAAFWNRSRAYPALGFDRFIDGSAFDPERIVGLFTSDEAMTDRVLEELSDEGPPQFLFAVSMENHGPFDWRPNLDQERLAKLPMPEQLDAGGRLWFGNYLYLLDDADRELGRLASALAKRERRTLLLFYGDHLPGLAPVYFQLGFDDGRDAAQQPVPWLLFDSRNPRQHRRDAHAWMLPALLLDAAGIRDDAYFNLLASLARSPDFDPDDPATAAGMHAIARLHLRGELDEVLGETLGLAALPRSEPDRG